MEKMALRKGRNSWLSVITEKSSDLDAESRKAKPFLAVVVVVVVVVFVVVVILVVFNVVVGFRANQHECFEFPNPSQLFFLSSFSNYSPPFTPPHPTSINGFLSLSSLNFPLLSLSLSFTFFLRFTPPQATMNDFLFLSF